MASKNKFYLPIEQIDRAIELKLRRAVVAAGYWPDNALYLNDAAGFAAAKQAIKDSGKPLIEIFGTGAKRGQLADNMVVIHRIGLQAGNIGLGGHAYFEKNADGSFEKMRAPETTENIEYEIRFVCDDIVLDRALFTIMQTAFGNRKWLHGVLPDMSDAENGFWFTRFGNAVDLSSSDYLERLWRFMANDVVISPDVVERSNVPAAVDVGFDIGMDEQPNDQPANVAISVDATGNETAVTTDGTLPE